MLLSSYPGPDERPLELDPDQDLTSSRSIACPTSAQDAVDAELGVPEAGVVHLFHTGPRCGETDAESDPCRFAICTPHSIKRRAYCPSRRISSQRATTVSLSCAALRTRPEDRK